MSKAQELLAQDGFDGYVLDPTNLDNEAHQKTQDYGRETTTWIFADESALSLSAGGAWQVINNHGFDVGNEQL